MGADDPPQQNPGSTAAALSLHRDPIARHPDTDAGRRRPFSRPPEAHNPSLLAEGLRSARSSQETIALGLQGLRSLAEALMTHDATMPERDIAFSLREAALAFLAHAVEVENHGRGHDLSPASPFIAYGQMLKGLRLHGANAIPMLDAEAGQPIVKQLLPHGIRAYGQMLAQLDPPMALAIELLKERDDEGRPALLEAYRQKDLATIRVTAEAASALQLPACEAFSLVDAEYEQEGTVRSGLAQARQEQSLAALALVAALRPLRDGLINRLVAGSRPLGLPAEQAAGCGRSISKEPPPITASPRPVSIPDASMLRDSVLAFIQSQRQALPPGDERLRKLTEIQSRMQAAWVDWKRFGAGHVFPTWIIEGLGMAFKSSKVSPENAARQLGTPACDGVTMLRAFMRMGCAVGLWHFGQILKQCHMPLLTSASLLNSESDGHPPPLLAAYEQGDLEMIRTFAGLLKELAFPAGRALSLLDVDSVPLWSKPKITPVLEREVQKLRIELAGVL